MTFYALVTGWARPCRATKARPTLARLGRGFTLVELLVALAVLGLLTALAAPSFQSLLAGQAVDAQAGELAASLRLARSEALKRGLEVSVCASSNGSSCADKAENWLDGWIAFSDTNNDGVRADDEVLIRVQSVVKGVSSVDASGKSLTFARSGILLKEGAALEADKQFSLVLKPLAGGDNATRTVCLNRQGRVVSLRGEKTCE